MTYLYSYFFVNRNLCATGRRGNPEFRFFFLSQWLLLADYVVESQTWLCFVVALNLKSNEKHFTLPQLKQLPSGGDGDAAALRIAMRTEARQRNHLHRIKASIQKHLWRPAGPPCIASVCASFTPLLSYRLTRLLPHIFNPEKARFERTEPPCLSFSSQ